MLKGHMCECDLGEDDPSEALVTCSAPGAWPLIGQLSSAWALIGRRAGDTLSSSGRDQQFYRAMRGAENFMFLTHHLFRMFLITSKGFDIKTREKRKFLVD